MKINIEVIPCPSMFFGCNSQRDQDNVDNHTLLPKKKKKKKITAMYFFCRYLDRRVFVFQTFFTFFSLLQKYPGDILLGLFWILCGDLVV